MRGPALFLSSLALAGALAGCGDSAQERVAIPLYVAGSAAPQPIEARGGFSVELARAEVAFGPLYLCAGVLAGDACDTARLEWLESVALDALDPTPILAGSLSGVSGPVRSAMYDFGIAQTLARPEPFVLEAADALGGVSVRLAGAAVRDDARVEFELALPIGQGDDAERGVSVVRVSGSRALAREVRGDEAGLLVRFDPAPWLAGVDFEAAQDELEGGGAPFAAGGAPARALRTTLLVGAEPAFEWLSAPP